MAIKDLKARQGNVDLVFEVVDKGEVREFEKFGRKGKVCTAKVKDNSGEIALTLWNEQVDMVNIGDKFHIINGYVNEFQGERQLTTGKFGKLELVGSKDVSRDEETEAEVLEGEKTDEGEKVLTEDEKTEEELLDESTEPLTEEEEVE
jgi:replication factor A1